MPEPLIPKIGFGINVACKLCLAAIALTATLNVATLSAAVKISAYLKSTSCCPSATSWWEASISNPISCKVKTMSDLTSSPKSSGPTS